MLVNEPKVERTGGGAVAAPVFARVVAGALRLLAVPPDGEAIAVAEHEGPVRQPRGAEA